MEKYSRPCSRDVQWSYVASWSRIQERMLVTLHAKLSCAVYCNQSCLWVCVCGCVCGSVTTITWNCVNRSSPNWFIDKGSDHLKLIKFWPSSATGKGVCGRAKIFGSALLQPYYNVCVSLSAFFIKIASPEEPYFTYRKTSDRSPQLLSVQVSRTPCLYAGPGVYPGPGLYHNMSSLCYFIQKIVNFYVYRVPVFCLFSH